MRKKLSSNSGSIFAQTLDRAIFVTDFAVSDCYDALIRPGANPMAMSPEGAVGEIVAHSGTQFDPQVTEALKQLALRGEIPGADSV